MLESQILPETLMADAPARVTPGDHRRHGPGERNSAFMSDAFQTVRFVREREVDTEVMTA
jgi:hypothetical protein